MKKTYLLIIAAFISLNTAAQLSTKERPVSFGLNKKVVSLPIDTKTMPLLDMESIKKDDAVDSENSELRKNTGIVRTSMLDQPWSFEIRSATKGDLKTAETVNGRSATISTASWPKGIYVIKAILGKDEVTEKIIVK